MKERIRQWLRSLLLPLLAPELAELERFKTVAQEAADDALRANTLLGDYTLAIDHRTKSDSWMIIGAKGRDGKPDLVRVIPIRYRDADDLIKHFSALPKSVMLDTPDRYLYEHVKHRW